MALPAALPARRPPGEEKPPAAADVCPDCLGTGWAIERDGGAGVARPCECRKRLRQQELLARSGIPERYRACRLTSFETETPDSGVREALLEAEAISRQYVDTFFDPVSRRYAEGGLVFVGRPGCGKTHLASAILTKCIQRYGVRGRFVDFTTLVHQIQATFDPSSPASKHEVLDPVIGTELLVLDELGAQKPSEWVMNTLYLIINTRYTERRPTLFTTNFRLGSGRDRGQQPADLVSDQAVAGANPTYRSSSRLPIRDDYDPDLLSTRISSALVSRLHQMARPVVLPDRDYRREGPLRRRSVR